MNARRFLVAALVLAVACVSWQVTAEDKPVAATAPVTASAPAAALASPQMIDSFDSFGKVLLSASAALADRFLNGEAAVLNVLAQTDQARSADWDKVKNLVVAAQAATKTGVVWYALPDGTYFTADRGRMEAKLTDRAYFATLLSGKSVMGSLVVSKSTGKKSVVLAVPVMSEGKVVAAVGASIFLEELSEAIGKDLKLPDCLAMYALAPDGTTVLHKNYKLVFDDPRSVESGSAKAGIDAMLAKESGEVSYTLFGFQKRVLFQMSPLTQWRFAIVINVAPAPKK